MALDDEVGEAAGLVEAGDAVEQDGAVVGPHHRRRHLFKPWNSKISAEISTKFEIGTMLLFGFAISTASES